MRFVCDSCRAQYMISDDKVGAKGVKVRCKKCGYVILVRKAHAAAAAPAPAPQMALGDAGDAMATQVMDNPLGRLPEPGQNFDPDVTSPRTKLAQGGPPQGTNGSRASGVLASVPDDEISNVFDQVLNSAQHKIPDDAQVGDGKALGDSSDDRMSTRVLDADMVKKLADESAGEAKNGAAKNGEGAAASQDWFVAVDEKQVGPLNVDKIKAMWERGEIGPDSLCWRAGFSDWTALSEVAELASTLAPKPGKPVIVAPASMPAPQVVTVPVESAFSAGGVTRTVRSEVAVNMAPATEETGGWKPSAASALQSLVKEEIDALSRPAPKAAAAPEPMVEDRPARQSLAGGLLDSVPDATPLRGNGQASQYARPAAPESMSPMATPYAAPAYQAQYPQYRPQQDSSKKMIIIGAVLGLVLLLALVGLVGYLLASKNNSPVVAGVQSPPPPVAIAKNDPQMPPPPPGMQKVATPPVASATPGPAAVPPTTGTPPPAAVATNTPPAPRPERKATSESSRPPPAPREPREARPPPTSKGTETSEAEKPSKRQSVEEPKGDDFDSVFGGPKKGKGAATRSNDEAADEKPQKSKPKDVYIPPAPGAGGDVPDQVGQGDIMQVVVSHKPEIIDCVKKQKAKDPDSGSGTLVMSWVIQTSGKTTNIQAKTDEFKSTPLASCMSTIIRGWVFPKHKQTQDPVQFPFKF